MRGGTWVVAGAVLALAAIATADALRTEASEPPRAAAASTSTAAQTTPVEGLSGVLYYTDGACRLRALGLPELAPEEGPAFRSCTISLSQDGERIEPGEVAWHPGGSVVARTDGSGTTLVLLDEGGEERSRYRFRASAASFGEHGFLTFALGEQIRGMDAGCPLAREEGPFIEAPAIRECSRVFVPAQAVRRAALRHLNAPDDPDYPVSVAVREIAWLDGLRLAALLRLYVSRIGDFDLVALFEGGEIVETLVALEPLHHLRASPGGRWLAVLTSAGRVLHYDREGRAQAMPNIVNARSFDWSPDEAWLAIATRNSVYVARPGAIPASSRRLALVANDLAWR